MRRWLGAEQDPNAGARHGGIRREPRISKECRPIGGRSPAVGMIGPCFGFAESLLLGR